MGKTARIGQINLDTGEILENVRFAAIPAKKVNGFERNWFAMSQNASVFIALSEELSGVDLRVLYLLYGWLDYENLIAINQSELAKIMKMGRNNFNRSIKNLVANGILIEGAKLGVNRSYMLNPHLGWKGSGKNHKAALKEHKNNIIKMPKEWGAPETKRDPKTIDFINGKPDNEL